MADVSCESSSSVILPTTACTSNNAHMMCEDGDTAMTIQADDTAGATNKPANPTRRVSATTQGALDALVELAATEPASLLSPQITITPHQTSSEDEESMPPLPPRSPKTMLAARDLLAAGATSIRGRSNSNADVPLQPTFTFLQQPAATAEPSQKQPTFTFLHDSTPFDNLDRTPSSPLGGRLRSASNPEGMEKWDLYSRRNDRQHFVLPSSILEEELASTRRVLGEVVDDNGEYTTTTKSGSSGRGCGAAAGFQQHWVAGAVRRSKRSIARLGTSPDDVTDMGEDESSPPSSASKSTKKKSSAASNNSNKTKSSSKKKSSSNARSKSPPKLLSKLPPVDELEDDVDDSTLEPEELLRRARSRLLEDLSEGGNGSEENGGLNISDGYALDIKGGVLILPHSLSKYKEVYNKNGRIGIYTPAERAAIIHKFNAKRARRVWNKKIRYNCRKNLADRRMRVKGRFVKRSVSEAATPTDNSPPPEAEEDGKIDEEELKMMHNDESAGIKAKKGIVRPTSPPTSGSPLPPVKEDEAEQLPMDEDMPDVDDEEAGFDPSEDMPYRRQRRYTIT